MEVLLRMAHGDLVDLGINQRNRERVDIVFVWVSLRTIVNERERHLVSCKRFVEFHSTLFEHFATTIQKSTSGLVMA